MSEKIQPALTPEQWRGLLNLEEYAGTNDITVWGHDWGDGRGEPYIVLTVDHEAVEHVERHAIAAVCLHGQPFGFTWKHVDMVNEAIQDLHGWWEQGPDDEYPLPPPELVHLRDLIAALLPPREEA